MNRIFNYSPLLVSVYNRRIVSSLFTVIVHVFFLFFENFYIFKGKYILSLFEREKFLKKA